MRHGSVGQPSTSRYRGPDGNEPPVHDNVSQAFALDVAPSMPRGWIRPVPMAALRARAARLCLRGLWRLPAGSLVLRWVDAAGAVAAHVVIGPVVATPPAVWRPMDATRGWQGGLACWQCRSCCRATRCWVVDGPRSEAHDRSAQDNHNDQPHGGHVVHAQDCHRDHFSSSQNQRQQLDYCYLYTAFLGIVFLGAAYYC